MTFTYRVVPAVLTSGQCVQIKVDTDAVFPRPLDGLEEVSVVTAALFRQAVKYQASDARPRGLRKEGLVIPRLNGPIRKRDANEVESSSSDIREVLLRLQLFELDYSVSGKRKTRTMNVL